jgi:hypothetical protein
MKLEYCIEAMNITQMIDHLRTETNFKVFTTEEKKKRLKKVLLDCLDHSFSKEIEESFQPGDLQP